jgi:hypothetical protein
MRGVENHLVFPVIGTAASSAGINAEGEYIRVRPQAPKYSGRTRNRNPAGGRQCRAFGARGNLEISPDPSCQSLSPCSHPSPGPPPAEPAVCAVPILPALAVPHSFRRGDYRKLLLSVRLWPGVTGVSGLVSVSPSGSNALSLGAR